MIALNDIPRYGSGLGYRSELEDPIMESIGSIDFVEVLADRFVEDTHALSTLRTIATAVPVVPHGTGLSLGWAGDFDRDYLAGIRRVIDVTGASYYSEHLCMTSVPGIDLGHLSPIQYSDELLKVIIRKVDLIQAFLERPLILENLSFVVRMPGSQYTEAEFFDRLTNATGCGMLLDLTNLYTNSVNFKFDPYLALESYPLESVVQVHLAGGTWKGEFLVDSHSRLVPEPVWKLLEFLASRVRVRAVLIEHDQSFPEFSLLLDQVVRARQILGGGRSAAQGSRPV